MFINTRTLNLALTKTYGTAGHLLKIWFTLKHMGLGSNSESVKIDTVNSNPSLKRLFSWGASDGKFYIPFAHTPRYLTMQHDASRSIIQTTIQRWATSGSVVTCDPTGFLEFNTGDDGKLQVSAGRRYPFGLGIGESGFALREDARVSIPIRSFAVWYGKKTDVPLGVDPSEFLVTTMLEELNISPAERELIFVSDDLEIELQQNPLADSVIVSICQRFIDGEKVASTQVHLEDFSHYTRRMKTMVTGLNQPPWMRTPPAEEVQELLRNGAKAVLLYGPPRTGKTRMIDQITDRNSSDRCTIQIHEGWGYDHLVEGLKPDSNGNWIWKNGPLKDAILSQKKYIVLEEINRTAFSQALGEVFSLIEDVYRGEKNSITLRSGENFWIPDDTVFLMTMNTIDKSTEDIDDALMGRVMSVEFPARPEDLTEMLTSNDVPTAIREKLLELFGEILGTYPLGHGYFAGVKGNIDNPNVIRHYKARIRPVLLNFLGQLKAHDLARIDNLVDDLFGKP